MKCIVYCVIHDLRINGFQMIHLGFSNMETTDKINSNCCDKKFLVITSGVGSRGTIIGTILLLKPFACGGHSY